MLVPPFTGNPHRIVCVSGYRVISPILPFVLGRIASGRFVPLSGSFRQYQVARDGLIALQKCAYTESWYTDSINHHTSVGTMWHLINRTIKKRPTNALHHSPHEYAAQGLITTWSAESQTCNVLSLFTPATSNYYYTHFCLSLLLLSLSFHFHKPLLHYLPFFLPYPFPSFLLPSSLPS